MVKRSDSDRPSDNVLQNIPVVQSDTTPTQSLIQSQKSQCVTVKSSLLLFVIFSVYIFDPASPRPVAVQAAVSRKTDIIAAAFYPTSLVRGSTEGHSTKMSKLYFLTAKQVNCLFCEFFRVIMPCRETAHLPLP